MLIKKQKSAEIELVTTLVAENRTMRHVVYTLRLILLLAEPETVDLATSEKSINLHSKRKQNC